MILDLGARLKAPLGEALRLPHLELVAEAYERDGRR